MTFKHVKFEDSPIMRSLEKVAKEKGLVKPETIQKQASIEKKADYTPSDNLMENILKLCSGLRSKGLVKEAAELETNYLNYKQAQTLYETSKETGDDLVQFAHPKGSHKLEGVEGDEATFEDILDVHVKHLEMVAKKPTGKLSNASQIFKEVKKVLGEQQSAQQLLREASTLIKQALAIASKGGGLSDRVLNWASSRAQIVATISTKNDQNLTLNDATDAEDATNAISRNLHPNLLHNYLPEFMNKGISSDDVWVKIEGILNAASQKIKDAKNTIKSGALSSGDDITESPAAATVQPQEKINFQTRVTAVLQELSLSKLGLTNAAKFNQAERDRFNPKIDAYVKQLQNLQTLASRMPDVSEFLTQLQNIEAWSAKLDQWIKSAG